MCLILEGLSPPNELEAESDGWDARNADLARTALVGRRWQGCAYSVLYGHMRICWCSSQGLPLLRSFAANPALHALVRTVDVYRLNERQYLADWLYSDVGLREMKQARSEAIEAGGHLDVNGAPFARVAALGVQEVRKAVEAQRDHLWLIGAESVRDGSAKFWRWIGQHSVSPRLVCRTASLTASRSQNLGVISIRNFEEAVPVLPSLVSALARLTRVAVAGALPPGLLPHLVAVESLLLAGEPSAGSSEAKSEVALEIEVPLPHLVTFGACGWPTEAMSVISRSPVAMRDLQLNHADTATMDALAALLPSLANLLVLNLSILPPHTASPSFLAVLPTSTIERLATNIWPPLELSRHLPQNLRAVGVVAHLDSEKPLEQLFAPFEDVLAWKDRRAPHLEAIEITFPHLGAERESLDLRKRFRARGERVKGFDLLVMEALTPAEDDDG